MLCILKTSRETYVKPAARRLSVIFQQLKNIVIAVISNIVTAVFFNFCNNWKMTEITPRSGEWSWYSDKATSTNEFYLLPHFPGRSVWILNHTERHYGRQRIRRSHSHRWRRTTPQSSRATRTSPSLSPRWSYIRSCTQKGKHLCTDSKYHKGFLLNKVAFQTTQIIFSVTQIIFSLMQILFSMTQIIFSKKRIILLDRKNVYAKHRHTIALRFEEMSVKVQTALDTHFASTKHSRSKYTARPPTNRLLSSALHHYLPDSTTMFVLLNRSLKVSDVNLLPFFMATSPASIVAMIWP